METIVRFGPNAQLVGILSGTELAADAPVLVLPNAGLVPRAGPFRLHVELARRLLALGWRTFRFDLPGVGESARDPGFDYREATLAALEYLGANLSGARFAVGGVCSAADLGWMAALSNERVAGVMMLDGMCYAGPWFQLARFTAALRRDPRHWFGIARRLIQRKRVRTNDRPMDLRNWPPLHEARVQMATLLARGVRFLCVYTGGIGDYFLDVRQFGWTFRAAASDPRVRLHHWPDCDHTYFARAHRERLLDTVITWLVNDVSPAASVRAQPPHPAVARPARHEQVT
jgi:pimeloyl-ACP methyl ester carboxylesterase